jgi:RimJ/RimL family protein N-acetyltransferase
MQSKRLTYEPVTLPRLEDFHSLVIDEHVRRYLMDGDVFPIEWSEARVVDSNMLFERRGVGLWLVDQSLPRALVGFCGFLEMPPLDEPQLVYAVLEQFTGKGYATEMARAAIEYARTRAGFTEIAAGVDGVNVKSRRVLEKIGFKRTLTVPGRFGNLFVYRLSL